MKIIIKCENKKELNKWLVKNIFILKNDLLINVPNNVILESKKDCNTCKPRNTVNGNEGCFDCFNKSNYNPRKK